MSPATAIDFAMFNACRRSSVSISRIAAAASSKPLSTLHKQSILSLSAGKPQIAVAYSRSFHSSFLHSYNVAARRRVDENEVPQGSSTEGLGEDGEYITKFQDLADRGLVHSNVTNQITQGMGHETMTPVQSMTINETLKGTDV